MPRIDTGPSPEESTTTSRDKTGISVFPPETKNGWCSVVHFPFSPAMRDAVLNGKKLCTTRYEKKGEIGDYFPVDDVLFQIVDIWHAPLYVVHQLLYRLEGTDSPEAFEKLWRGLHRGHFSTGKEYWIHFFARCSEEAIL
ncbi:MAG: hypothetical protein D4R45_03245 [Planctomycetaceae bacterium]|nr:MAG: hypothetical protein D4R45_03245 [Planctomycetaceae bacterium]